MTLTLNIYGLDYRTEGVLPSVTRRIVVNAHLGAENADFKHFGTRFPVD